MSNAAVINATATLGRVVGSPITIVTDGTVTPKAYGKGAGAWSATLAFAPVVNGVTGSPVTLTISNNQPANVAQSILTDATSWVGWVVSSVGEFEATGIVEGVTGSDSLSGFLGIYKDDASAPKYAIEANSTAMVAGISKTWNGSHWITPAALGGGIIYDGVTYPLPLSAPYKGYKIAVVNPAVLDGWSTLKWTGAGWAPPAGELIVGLASSTALQTITPGAAGLFKAFESPIIPDYMIPEGVLFSIGAGASMYNPSGASGAGIGVTINNALPIDSVGPFNSYLTKWSGTPPSVSGGSGVIPTIRQGFMRNGSVIRAPAQGIFLGDIGGASYGARFVNKPSSVAGFAPGATRAYVMALTSHINDTVEVTSISVRAEQ